MVSLPSDTAMLALAVNSGVVELATKSLTTRTPSTVSRMVPSMQQ